jgi:hypothetical protein
VVALTLLLRFARAIAGYELLKKKLDEDIRQELQGYLIVHLKKRWDNWHEHLGRMNP